MALSFGSMEVMALGTMRHISNATLNINTSMRRLSSGKRINSAKDDPAGLAIANRMTAQIRGLHQARRNTYDAMSILETADGTLGITGDIVQRIRELSVQAANGSYNDEDRQSFQTEVDQLVEEIDRISSSTSFNNIPLLGGTFKNKHIQVGANAGETIDLSLESISAATLGENNDTIANLDLTTQEGASKAIEIADKALSMIDSQRSYTGAMLSRLDFTIANQSNMIETQSAARSRIMDTDIAAEASALARNRVLQQAGIAMLSQVNQQGELMLQLLR